MRYVRIFFLHFQKYIEIRSRSFVWFLLSLIGPLLMILFWKGASEKGNLPDGWTFSLISSYYLLVIIAGAFLMSHVEEDVGVLDIQEGNLTSYLLKPFSYYWTYLADEFPYRCIQGFFGIISLLIFLHFLGNLFSFTNSILVFLLSILIAVFAYFLAFTFKMIIGLLAFWLTEIRGLFEVIEVLLAIFAGYLMPIALLPNSLAHISYILPFSYIIYFPIIAFEGKLSPVELLRVLAMQVIWLGIFYILYKKLWKEGIKKYSAIGQ